MRKTHRTLTLDEIEWIMSTDTSNEGCAQILGCTPGAIAATRRLSTDKARWVAEYLGQKPASPKPHRQLTPAIPGATVRQNPAEVSLWRRILDWLFADWIHA